MNFGPMVTRYILAIALNISARNGIFLRAETMRMRKLTTMLAAVSLLASPAAAQQITTQGSGLQRTEAVVAVGITIPFGGTRRSDPPRLELRMSRDMVQADGSRLSDRSSNAVGTSIGFALDRDAENRLWLNGRPLPQADQRHGVSTLGWVAIGVGVIVVGGGVLLADAARDASE